MEGLWQDIRYGVRKLVRQPGFTIAALLTLALGIGANAVLFTLINALLLRPPAGVTSPEKIVTLYTEDFSSGPLSSSSYADYLDFAKSKDVFAGVAVFAPQIIASGDVQSPTRVGLEQVSESYFAVLGAPLRGRSFTAPEAATAAPVAVISDDYWKKQLGSAPDAIGRTIQLNAKPVTVIGIAPPGFHGSIRGFNADVWLTMQFGAAVGANPFSATQRGDRGVMVIARLQPTVSMDAAQGRMNVLSAQLYKEFPQMWATVKGNGRRITLATEKSSRLPVQVRSKAYLFTGMLAAIVGLVLLICCANVAGLMVARASGMTKEMGIRISIGASRARIARLLLVESAILSLAAAAISLLATFWLSAAVSSLMPRLPFPIMLDLGVDHRVILFTSFVALFTAVVFGSIPALRASRADPSSVIKAGNAQITVGRHRVSFRSALVGVQVAASVVLLVTALLFLRSTRSALNADLGFKTDNVALMTMDPEPGYKPDDAEATRVSLAAVDLLQGTAGVKGVSWANSAPLSMESSRRGTSVEGYIPAKGEDMEFNFTQVGPQYLTTLGMPFARGRDVTQQDRAGAPKVVVVNQRFADRFWKGADPLGKRISFDGGNAYVTVVGVARDAHVMSVGNGDIPPFMFIPMLQGEWSGTTLTARVDNLTPARLKELKDMVQKASPRWQLRNEHTMIKQAEGSILPQRIASMVLTVFGSLALFLSAIGLYGVIAYAVAQRTHEFGIRFALGATTRDVLSLMLHQGLRVILIGAVAGMALTVVAAQLLKSLLLGLSPLDPISFIAAPLLLVMIGTAATLLPARRAARIDPLNALRSE